jgi:hypothetical protein
LPRLRALSWGLSPLVMLIAGDRQPPAPPADTPAPLAAKPSARAWVAVGHGRGHRSGAEGRALPRRTWPAALLSTSSAILAPGSGAAAPGASGEGESSAHLLFALPGGACAGRGAAAPWSSSSLSSSAHFDFLGFAPAAGVPSEGVPAPLPFWDPCMLPPSRGACTAGESTCMPSSTSPSSTSPSSRAVGHPQSASVREGQEAGRRARARGRFAWLPNLSIRPCHRRRPSSHHPFSQRPLESFPTPPSGFSAWTPSPVAAAPPPTRSSCLSASPLGSPPRRRRGEADSPGEQETVPLRTEFTLFCRRSHRQERRPASSTVDSTPLARELHAQSGKLGKSTF